MYIKVCKMVLLERQKVYPLGDKKISRKETPDVSKRIEL